MPIFDFKFIFFLLISSLINEKPFECKPDDFKAMSKSPLLGIFVFRAFSFSTIPTQNPARSYFSLGNALGCSAVSPPIKEQLAISQPFAMPFIISFVFRILIF